MAIIKQIAVYDQDYNQNNHWKINDIGVNDARNVSLSSNIRGQSNIQDALRTIDGSLSSVTTTTNNKVSKTGDTMTGSLNFKGFSNTNNSAVISFNDEDSSVSGLTLEGSKNISNNKIYNSLSLRINSNGEPIVDVDSNSSSPVDSAWRNAIKAFGKYGDQAHYGSIFIQPDPDSIDPDDSLYPYFPDREDWPGVYWKDKNNSEIGLINSYSSSRKDIDDVVIPAEYGIKINSKYDGEYYGGKNILKIGIAANGDPTVNISATSYDNLSAPNVQKNTTSVAQAAWRKAITGSSRVARVMNIAVLSTTTASISFNANEIKDINIEINNTDTLASDYTWNSFAGPINVHGHSHQNKLSFLAFYPGNIVQNGNRTVQVLVQNITNQSITDTITVRTLWFAVHNGTNNI